MSDPMTDAEKVALRALAIKHLQVHLAHNPNTVEMLDAFVANSEHWRMGFNPEEFHYWITPVTANERYLPGPFNVLRWDWHDFQAIKNYKPTGKA